MVTPVAFTIVHEKSCYVLEIRVEPGGWRRDSTWVTTVPDELREVLAREFLGDDAAFAAEIVLEYGQEMSIGAIQNGYPPETEDIHSFLTVWLPGLQPLRLDDGARRRAAAKHLERLRGDADALRGIRFELDWDGIAAKLPALKGELLRPGEILEIREVEAFAETDDGELEPMEGFRWHYR